MIVQDKEKLKIPCRMTTLEECRSLGVFSKLDHELAESPVPGAGLSANQIGLDVCACTVRITESSDDCQYPYTAHMINPKIEVSNFPVIHDNEGCLSFPGARINTNRFTQVTCSWLDFDRGELRKAIFYGFESFVVQHEIDHLAGITLFDRAAKPTVKVGRNDPCTCGSGKKYKKCCLICE